GARRPGHRRRRAPRRGRLAHHRDADGACRRVIPKRLYNTPVPLQDGTRLATDIYLPETDAPHPTVLGRTPYGKNNPCYRKLIDDWNSRGYALAIQDVRGRGDSDGSFVPYRNESRDGADTVQWIAAQQWSSGDVIIQ